MSWYLVYEVHNSFHPDIRAYANDPKTNEGTESILLSGKFNERKKALKEAQRYFVKKTKRPFFRDDKYYSPRLVWVEEAFPGNEELYP